MPFAAHLSPPQKKVLLPDVGHPSLLEREDLPESPTFQPYELVADTELTQNISADSDSAGADTIQDGDQHSGPEDTESLPITVRSSRKRARNSLNNMTDGP